MSKMHFFQKFAVFNSKIIDFCYTLRYMNWVIRIVVIGILVLVGWIYEQVTSANRDDQGNISKAGEVNAFEFKVGDCLADVGLEVDFESTTGVPCSDNHALEVFASTNIPMTILYDSEEYNNFIDDFCGSSLLAYAGINANLDEYTYSFLRANAETFADGERGIDCVVERIDGMLTTGSIKNIGR